jgi:hypothetical protein
LHKIRNFELSSHKIIISSASEIFFQNLNEGLREFKPEEVAAKDTGNILLRKSSFKLQQQIEEVSQAHLRRISLIAAQNKKREEDNQIAFI